MSQFQFENKRFNRRNFMQAAGATVGAASLGGLLAACGGGGAGASDQVTVTFWDWWVTQAPWVDNEIKLFEKAHPKIKIKKTTQATAQYENLLNLAAKNGNLPDVFGLKTGTTKYPDMVKKGWLLPLDKWADDKWRKRFPEGYFREGGNIQQGKLYSAPLMGPAPWVQLYVHNSIFKDAGLTNPDGSVKLPKTWDDVTHAAEAIVKKSGGKVYGLGFGNNGFDFIPWWADVFLYGAGSPGASNGLDYRTGKYVYSSDRNYEDFLSLFLEWKKRGYIYPSSLSISDEISRVHFTQGKFGMIVGGVWNQGGWDKQKFTDYSLTTLISPTETPKGYFYHTPGNIDDSIQISISNKTKHPDEAWAWFEWIYSPEAGQRWVEMREGVSIYPENNKKENVKDPRFGQFIELTKLTIPGPNPSVRNPACSSVTMDPVKPNFGETCTGLYTGQLGNVKTALSELEDKMNQEFAKAIKRAQDQGLKVSEKDYVFSDWDITKPYYMK
ncbi:ABC-type glycerol-3-phosphate transport system substrate-binding protein [Thermosporothrix hazakensis]|jgi:ABC-type glycerol-3-phosphate transport system substrate-binding protein|uniref:ABC-type glycerol-3-phosphate transport system substrate-binding protein n=2 Tax=Thermosporothrix TaxID=768650 RepID=A0A326U566_THEHA|nr:extracellular solute-binding protein [Thermosporothrix hazakensis]PZW27475.1 ABC-type glycerol-3-phosphate transport system substrate-binding protein [Thermosporothrix hazakensis]BBH85932.1 hypothetical protein KTC_06830 [Thermosporothrix sp. COM3]GCE45641.1 hypothetical protein KTH_05100 [Thermosporothrix hazakensis]